MIFVFGSNLAGRHGKGAAKVALNTYRAVYGMAEGPQGRSYAIPTKDARFNSLHLDEIAHNIDRFLRYANEFPGYEFQVTRIGCGLAGHQDSAIAAIFDDRLKYPSRHLFFDEVWRPYLKEGSVFWGTF